MDRGEEREEGGRWKEGERGRRRGSGDSNAHITMIRDNKSVQEVSRRLSSIWLN